MNVTPQQMHQQHAMVRDHAHALLNKVKSSAPHSQLTQAMDHHVRTLESMLASGKSQASIDAHMKTMNQTIVSAQKQAYASHTTPQPGHYGSAQFGQSGQQNHQFGQQPTNTGHYQPTSQPTHQQSTDHFTPGPSVHTLDDARVMMRDMSKVGHNGNSLF